jgi:hypothetical protein
MVVHLSSTIAHEAIAAGQKRRREKTVQGGRTARGIRDLQSHPACPCFGIDVDQAVALCFQQ